MSQKNRVIALYKNLQYLLKEYPADAKKMQIGCKKAFLRNKDETDPKKIEEMIEKGEYVKKEIETLYALKKYRAMKKRYYD
ncbi:unnamed protein product [Chironomus riparius]|uniref:Complex 1 LYR protein domain-containing protein n=1 Tax=Chironomus riparius TaxID=315576 RepID=A0A9N9RJX1_9DIPT|nr:unnamed protein product [Chironomus riparius]